MKKKKAVWTVGKRLGLSYFMLTVLLIVSGAVGFNSTRMLTETLDFVTEEAWTTADGTMEGVINVQRQIILIQQIVNTPQLQEKLVPVIQEAELDAKKAFERTRGTNLLPEDSIKRLDYYLKEFSKARDASLAFLKQGAAGDDFEGEEIQANLEVKVDDLLGFLDDLEMVADQKIEQETSNIALVVETAYISILAMLVSGVLVALVFYFSNSRKIVQPLRRAAAMMEDIAQGEGNLTVRMEVNGEDEIAKMCLGFNHFVEKLRDTMQRVTAATAQLATATEEMSSIAEESRAGINKQRNETDMVATSMNEMSATTQEVARNAADASSSAAEANDHALNGEKVVELTIGAIERLANEVSNARGAISTLNEDSANIAGVLDVIKDIAEQTNLLALNAAIEAARAGEQGRGFAVVADEVRTLASRTRESTEEIEQMIGRLLEATQNAVSTMETGQTAAQDAVATSDTARKALRDITSSVDSIVGLNNQIATAAEQQGVMAEEVNRSITNITNIAIETDAGAEQTSNSTEEMARLANELQGLVQQFKV